MRVWVGGWSLGGAQANLSHYTQALLLAYEWLASETSTVARGLRVVAPTNNPKAIGVSGSCARHTVCREGMLTASQKCNNNAQCVDAATVTLQSPLTPYPAPACMLWARWCASQPGPVGVRVPCRQQPGSNPDIRTDNKRG